MGVHKERQSRKISPILMFTGRKISYTLSVSAPLLTRSYSSLNRDWNHEGTKARRTKRPNESKLTRVFVVRKIVA